MDLQVVAIKALQLLCCLSLLVVLHEFGHYGFSKLFRVKVEKFYMFFNPKFHLFSTRDKWFTRLFPYFKNNETEYGIGWLPLGGYVKIAGMVDESMDTEQMKQPAQPWEFRSQKVWKRFFIMAGGVIMNLITAWVIYSAVLFTWGHEYIPMRNITGGFQFNEYAQSIGFRNGDIPVAADGDSIIEFSVSNLRTISNASVVTVLRGGEEVQLTMPEGFESFTFFGYGPHESYVDKNLSTYVDKFETTVTDNFEHYVRPQENSSHYGTKWAEVRNDNGVGFYCKPVNFESFSVNAQHFTPNMIHDAKHDYELEPMKETVLSLDYKNLSCGSASCGPISLDKYRLLDKAFNFTFRIAPGKAD